MKLRIVSRLDIKGPNLVKGVNLEGLRILGKPQQFAKVYYEEGIDELIYIAVSLNCNFSVLATRMSSENSK